MLINFIFLFILVAVASTAYGKSPLVDVSHLDPSLKIEMRYFSDWNFIGKVIAGYQANKCLLAPAAARALAQVQRDLKPQGLSLLLLDCYRPQMAVDEFVSWTKNADEKMKPIFYQEEPKADLITNGYIAAKSGHSRGSTVDLTLVKINAGKRSAGKTLRYQEEPTDCRKQSDITSTGQLDMGTTMDCFSKLANTDNTEISDEAKNNRQILRQAMEKRGFYNYPQEWWHFTLKNEPFKEAFEFPIK